MLHPGSPRLNFVTSVLPSPRLCVLGMAMCFGTMPLLAQDTAAQSEATPTLHVYTNLIQIPVLVLTSGREKLPSPIAPNRFSISLSSGPSFRPVYARLEGEDPIDLAIVLDARSPQEDLLPKMDQAIADLAPSFLRPNDHVSVYAIDCSSLDFVEDVPADSVQLKRAVDRVLSKWTARRQKIKAACSQSTHLWDFLAFAANKLSTHTGRRVVLAVTDGDDQGSKRSLNDLTSLAETEGVTIFGLAPAWQGNSQMQTTDEGLLSNACERSGGMLFTFNGSSAAKTLQRFTAMLRERYILEFPRPANAQAGHVLMSVKVDKGNLFIRASGDGVPLANRAVMTDASTIHPGQTAVPQVPELSVDSAPAAGDQSKPAPATVQQMPAVVLESAPATASVVAEPPLPSTVTPTLKVTTRLTIENVTVTDAHGRPVHGLDRSEFSIKEDGKPQPIRDFEEYGTEVLPPQAAARQLPEDVYTNAQPPPPNTSAVNILLLDDVTTGLMKGLAMAPENLLYAKQQAMKYLRNMPTGTQIAILQLSDRLNVVQGLTTNAAILTAAMNAVSYKPVAGAFAISPGQACTAANAQSQLVVNALEQAAAFLAGIKGRKNLIWFTPGIPWLTDYAAFSNSRCLNDYSPQLHRVYDLLTSAQVAVYPVDPRGLFTDPSFDASSTPRNLSGPAAAARSAAFGSNTAAEHNSLRDLADATGGVPYFDRNDLDRAVQEAVATGADYYSISYVPPLSKYDGKSHTIVVKVDRPNLHLQYRSGYTSVNPDKVPPSSEEKSSGEKSSKAAPPPSALDVAMGHGTAPSSQLLFDVRVTRSTVPAKPGDPLVLGSLNPTLKGKSLIRYDFLCTLAADQIALVNRPDGSSTASVEFVIVAYDAQGKMLNYFSQAAKWTLKSEQVPRFSQQSLQVPMQFDLPSGKIFVRVGLLDVPSQKIGTLEIPETVSK
jgi:VWFA-related protein